MAKKKGKLPKPVAAPAQDIKPRGMRIRPEAVAALAPRPAFVHFAPAQPPKGVVPDGVKPMALDDAGMGMFGGEYAGFASGAQWLGYPFLSELTQIPEYRLVSETIAKEMTRKWITIKATGDADKSAKIKTIEAEFKRHKIQDKFRRLAELDGFFGRGHLFIDTGAAEPELLKLPLQLKPAFFRKGSLKTFRVVEPVWAYPSRYNATDPLADDFYRPETWFVMGKEVHRTRFLTLVSREVPDILKPVYAFGGVSMSQMIRESVTYWQSARESVSRLIRTFSTMWLKTDMDGILNDGAQDELDKRIKVYTYLRDNSGVFALNRTEDMGNVSTPLGTLDHLQAQAQEHIASTAGIPLVVLTGISPSGLNASSEGELQVWAQRVHAMQEHHFNEPLKVVLEIIQLDQFGVIDPEIGFDFEPLKEASEEEKGKAEKAEAERDQLYANIGWIGPDEGRQVLASRPDSPYAAIDFSAPPPVLPENEPDPLDDKEDTDAESGADH